MESDRDHSHYKSALSFFKGTIRQRILHQRLSCLQQLWSLQAPSFRSKADSSTSSLGFQASSLVPTPSLSDQSMEIFKYNHERSRICGFPPQFFEIADFLISSK